MQIKLPKFTLLEKSNLGSHCDACSRELKNVYIVRNNETKEVGHFGSGCFKKFTGGKSVTEVAEEQEVYEKAVKRAEYDEARSVMGKTFMQAFHEAEPEMLAFIEANLDSTFILDMKKRIEETGSLTKNQYDAIYRMMLPWAQLGDKVKDLKVYVHQCKIEHNEWGFTYTLICVTEENEKVRIFFSSLNTQKQELLSKLGILTIDNRGEYETISTINRDHPLMVTGSFDGYKIKRAKIAEVEEC